MDLHIIHYAVLEEEPLPVCHTCTWLAPNSEVSPPAHTASQETEVGNLH